MSGKIKLQDNIKDMVVPGMDNLSFDVLLFA